MAKEYLDKSGLTYFWERLKAFFQPKLVSGTNIKTINNQSVLGSGNISISGGGGVTPADYIIEKGKSGNWYYEKWNSGKVEAWGHASSGTLSMTASGNLYRDTNVSASIPSGIFPAAPTKTKVFTHYTSAVTVAVSGDASSATAISYQVWKTTNNSTAVTVHFHCVYYPSDY